MGNRRLKQKADEIPKWSWMVAGLGLLLVAGSVGFMLYQSFTKEFSPPELSVETVAIIPGESSYLVQIRVVNRGGLAAAGVVIEGVLRVGGAGEAVETSGITIDYVPGGSQRKAGLIFEQDPRQFNLLLGAKGYEEP